MANLLKFYRGAVAPTTPAVGMIWFNNVTETVEGVEQVKNLIKVYTPNGWEVYGTTDADLQAVVARVTALEGAVATLKDVTLPALKAELEQAIAEAVAAEAEIARAAEEALGKRIDALAAKTVTINEKATGHVTVSKTTDETTGAVVYTVAENDIASAKGLADEIKRATDEEARIAGLVTTEQGRAEDAEKALADRLDVIEGEATVVGSIKKALADANAYTDAAKAAIEGTLADTDAKTLAALNDRIDTVVAEAKTYEMVKVETGLEANVKEQYQLVQKVGETSENVGAAIKIYKDSALQSAVLGTATVDGVEQDCLILTYLDVNGASQVVNIPVGDFLRESEFGNGLAINGGVVSVGVREADADFVVAEADQLNFAGAKTLITDGDSATLAAAKQYTDDAIAALDITVDSTSTIAEYAGEKDAEDTTSKIAIQLVEEDGKIKSIAVTETDIASAKMVHDHEKVVSAALNDLNARIGEVADNLAGKNVDAESTTPEYVTASAADNKVTVAATQKVIDAVGLAETSVQTITSANTCLTAVKEGNNVVLSLVWEDGSF